MNKRLQGISFIFLLVSLISGCASSLTSDKDPSVQLSNFDSFHVVHQPKDHRRVDQLLAAELISMGKNATYGNNAADPKSHDIVITYMDKWWWDITTYMLELKVELRDPDTNYIIATGHSYRTSLNRKSPEGMVKEVLNKIFTTP